MILKSLPWTEHFIFSKMKEEQISLYAKVSYFCDWHPYNLNEFVHNLKFYILFIIQGLIIIRLIL